MIPFPGQSSLRLTGDDQRLANISNCPKRKLSRYQKLANTPYIKLPIDHPNQIENRKKLYHNQFIPFSHQLISNRSQNDTLGDFKKHSYVPSAMCHINASIQVQKQPHHRNLNQPSYHDFSPPQQNKKINSPNQKSQFTFLNRTNSRYFSVVVQKINQSQNPGQSFQFKLNIRRTKSMTSTQLFQSMKTQLLKQVQSVYPTINHRQLSKKIIGFRSVNKNLQVDFILSLKEYSIGDRFFNQFQAQSGKRQQLYLMPVYEEQGTPTKKTIINYELVRFLGSGGFSNVYLAREKRTNVYCALKLILKQEIEGGNKDAILGAQKLTLNSLNHPFITKLYECFETQNFYVFVLEYCPGGQLFTRLRKLENMSEEEAKFYFLQILLALDHMHSKGFIYRDIKPENILIDINGHARLADFGLSKYIKRQKAAYSFCGSPEYMAPEMLNKRGHDHMLDIYCAGCLLYELIYSAPPFYSSDMEHTHNSILHQQIGFPRYPETSSEFKNFIRKILSKNPEDRIGAQGIDQIFQHPFMSRNCLQKSSENDKAIVNYKEKLLQKPPFVPSFNCGQLLVTSNEAQIEENSKEQERKKVYQQILQKEIFSEEMKRKKQQSKISNRKSGNQKLKLLSPNPVKQQKSPQKYQNKYPFSPRAGPTSIAFNDKTNYRTINYSPPNINSMKTNLIYPHQQKFHSPIPQTNRRVFNKTNNSNNFSIEKIENSISYNSPPKNHFMIGNRLSTDQTSDRLRKPSNVNNFQGQKISLNNELYLNSGHKQQFRLW